MTRFLSPFVQTNATSRSMKPSTMAVASSVESEARETAEARCAKDADKLEMLLQAVEYRDIGVQRVDGWIDSARKGLTTETARRIAEAAVHLSPLTWRER
jgi:putative hydrolase of HD superfamily